VFIVLYVAIGPKNVVIVRPASFSFWAIASQSTTGSWKWNTSLHNNKFTSYHTQISSALFSQYGGLEDYPLLV